MGRLVEPLGEEEMSREFEEGRLVLGELVGTLVGLTLGLEPVVAAVDITEETALGALEGSRLGGRLKVDKGLEVGIGLSFAGFKKLGAPLGSTTNLAGMEEGSDENTVVWCGDALPPVRGTTLGTEESWSLVKLLAAVVGLEDKVKLGDRLSSTKTSEGEVVGKDEGSLLGWLFASTSAEGKRL